MAYTVSFATITISGGRTGDKKRNNFRGERMTPDRQVIKSQRELVNPIQIRLRHLFVRGRRIGGIDRSIDRSIRTLVPPIHRPLDCVT